MSTHSMCPNQQKQIFPSQQMNEPEQSIDCFLMRHAQSKFNEVMHDCQFDCLSEQAKNSYQLDRQLIDCDVTQKGYREIDNIQFNQAEHTNMIYFDIIFVSPLNRALQTAQSVIQHLSQPPKKIIVVPHLTQVISKICDFGHSMQQKKLKYQNFDFSFFKPNNKGQQNSEQFQQFWQDSIIDTHFRNQIDFVKPDGSRYVKILKKIFPQPLQSVERCLDRSLRVIDQIKKISHKQRSKKILVVTHNRILKNILTRGEQEKLSSFKIMKNCQIRHMAI